MLRSKEGFGFASREELSRKLLARCDVVLSSSRPDRSDQFLELLHPTDRLLIDPISATPGIGSEHDRFPFDGEGAATIPLSERE